MKASPGIHWIRVSGVAFAIALAAGAGVLHTLPTAYGAGTARLADEATQAELLQATFGDEAGLGLQAVLLRAPLVPCSTSDTSPCYSPDELEPFGDVPEEFLVGLLNASGARAAHPEVPGISLVGYADLPGPFEHLEGTGTVGAASHAVVSASGDRAAMLLHSYGSCLGFTALNSYVRTADGWLLVASHSPPFLPSPP